MQVNKVPAGLWPALFLNNLHCRAFCPAVKLRAHARNEIRHYRDGLNPVITGLNCPASAGQYFSPTNRHLPICGADYSEPQLINQAIATYLGPHTPRLHTCFLFAKRRVAE